MTPAIRLQQVSKAFPGMMAVDHLDFELYQGRVHTLVGANGSGKSTTVKIIAGVYPPDSGTYFLKEKAVVFKSPQETKDKGIITVFQERQIFPDLSITENIFLNRLVVKEFSGIDWKASNKKAQEYIATFGLDFDCSSPMSNYGVGIQQMIEIVRGMAFNPDLLILDEPTASLSRREVENLFEFIGKLKQKNVAVLFIAHNLDEVLEISDEITVLRDGKKAAYYDNVREIDNEDLIRSMIGEDVIIDSGNAVSAGGGTGTRLEVCDLKLNTWNKRVSFKINKGEVLAVTGLIGSGASEIAKKVGGVLPHDTGAILMEGKTVQFKSIRDALKVGIVYLPPDRKRFGLFMNMSNKGNIIASILKRTSNHNFYSDRKAKKAALNMIEETHVIPPDTEFHTVNLSGGNQQKVLFSRIFAVEPQLIVMENPTVGVDVKAQAELHSLIRRKTKKGISVLLVSTDYREVSLVADRILIIREGEFGEELTESPFSKSAILHLVSRDTKKKRGGL